jgi:hypothetical protein
VNPNGLDTHYLFLYGTSSSLSGASQTPSYDMGSGTSASAISANIGGLTANTTYYFQLQASNSAGTTKGSISSFKTSVAVPATPTGLSPGGSSPPGTTVTTLTPMLTWNASLGATAYSVAVSMVGGGTVLAQNVPTNSVACPTLQNGATYMWAVSASNFAGSSATSPVVYFTVTPPAPTISGVPPNPVPASNNNQAITVNGSNFQSRATLTFHVPQGNTYPSVASKLTFVSSSQISYQFDNASDKGTWTVYVTNPDSKSSNRWSFTVR